MQCDDLQLQAGPPGLGVRQVHRRKGAHPHWGSKGGMWSKKLAFNVEATAIPHPDVALVHRGKDVVFARRHAADLETCRKIPPRRSVGETHADTQTGTGTGTGTGTEDREGEQAQAHACGACSASELLRGYSTPCTRHPEP